MANNPSPLVPLTPDVTPSPEAVRRAGGERRFEQLSLALPRVGIAVGTALALGGDRSTRKLGFATLVGSAVAAIMRWQLARVVTETASYEVEAASGAFEIRHYPESVHAETVVAASEWGASLSVGFRRLAGYIFGGNAAHSKIAMTAFLLSGLPGCIFYSKHDHSFSDDQAQDTSIRERTASATAGGTSSPSSRSATLTPSRRGAPARAEAASRISSTVTAPAPRGSRT